jgi:hypothetical protein
MKRFAVTMILIGFVAMLGATSLHAQGAIPIPPATPGCPHDDLKVLTCYDLQLYYGAIKNNLYTTLNQIPDDKFFTAPPSPAPLRGEQTSIGAEFSHAAEIQSRMCTLMKYKNPDWVWEAQWDKDTTKVIAMKLTTKADVMAALKKSFDQCDPLFFGVTEADLSKTVTGNHGPKPLSTTLFNVISHDREVFGRIQSFMANLGLRATGETQALTPKQKAIEDAAAAAARANRPAGGGGGGGQNQ